MTTVTEQPSLTVPEQAGRLLSNIAGYVAHRTVAIGLREGLIAALADASSGYSSEELAEQLGLDPFYVAVWCRAAVASGICDRLDGSADQPWMVARHQLAPHVSTLLLNRDHPAYVGGVFIVLEQPELFERFERSLATGERMWWDDCSPEWIAGVAGTGVPFYTRLVPGGLAQIAGLAEKLRAGARIVDIACGSGAGLIRLAREYPGCSIVGVDGDRHSLDRARRAVDDAGLADRIELVNSPLEELELNEPAALVINNISMHECRDVDRVTANVLRGLQPGGWFVISDFDFPENVEGLRSVPGRVMCGIQYFEAQIDDQLLPRTAYDELLARHGFADIGSVQLNAMHALTYGRAGGVAAIGPQTHS